MSKNQDITIYKSHDGEISFNVNVFEETVWLTQKQMAELFVKHKVTIGEHIANLFKEEELEQESVVRNFLTTAKDGKRYDVTHYNLDVIISVGYRVKSQRGTQFRRWSTQILKQHLINGYSINENRLKNIEDKIDSLSSELKKEFRSEIKDINKSLLELAKRPININNQISLTSEKLESKIIDHLDELIIKITKDKKLKNQLEGIKENLKTSPKDKNTKNKISSFFSKLGDNDSKLHKTIKGIGISKKIITELVKLGEKLKDFI